LEPAENRVFETGDKTDTRMLSFRAALDARPLSAFHYRLLALTVLLLFTDGYDTQAIGYVAPVLTELWHVERSSFGPIFSAGLIGLMAGAMIFTPIADRFGARRVLLGCTTAYAILTLATVWAGSPVLLLVLRFLTGLGLGGAMPSAIALVSDYSPTRVRTLMVTITVCGFSLGGAVGGAVAAVTMSRFGWQSVFVIGGIVPLLALAPLALWLPESLPRLLEEPALHSRLRTVLANLVPDWTVSADATSAQSKRQGFAVAMLFAGGYARSTLLIWAAFFCNLVLLYFLANWLPSVAHAGGLSVAIASLMTASYQGGGTVGALTLAWTCDRTKHPQLVLACVFLGAAVCCALLGSVGTFAPALIATACATGFCVIGGQTAANAVVGNYYPPDIRATGVGWALGIGRFGSIFGPLIGGILIGLQVPNRVLFGLFALPAFLAATCFMLIDRGSRRRQVHGSR
jgi:AAHS family 4-hydroxybenzoate transporter-like MFS transporter